MNKSRLCVCGVVRVHTVCQNGGLGRYRIQRE
jgi:hypothetical protein